MPLKVGDNVTITQASGANGYGTIVSYEKFTEKDKFPYGVKYTDSKFRPKRSGGGNWFYAEELEVMHIV